MSRLSYRDDGRFRPVGERERRLRSILRLLVWCLEGMSLRGRRASPAEDGGGLRLRLLDLLTIYRGHLATLSVTAVIAGAAFWDELLP